MSRRGIGSGSGGMQSEVFDATEYRNRMTYMNNILEKQRRMSGRGRVVFVYPHSDPLDPAGSGGQNRLYNLIEQTSHRYDVTTVGPIEELDESEIVKTHAYRQRTPGFLSDVDYGLATELYRTLRSVRPDIVHIPYPSGIVLTRILSKIARTDTRIVLDAHDVMSERARTFANDNLGAVSMYLRVGYVPPLESIATSVADHIITVSEKDAQLMQQLNGVPRSKLSVIPNGADPVDKAELSDRSVVREDLGIGPETATIVFHGNYETGTHNREAANRIIERIAPEFHDQENTQFFLIGKGAPEADIENVTSMGFIGDLYSTLNAMDIAIVPLTSGTATKLKMFDYMSVGLQIVSTEKGTEGIDLQDGKDVIISNAGTDQFVAAIRRLLKDEQLQKRLRRNGQSLIEQRYNWQTIGSQLDSVYRNLMAI